ncbi:MAG: dienelactone hydrolase family protein [Rhodospirillaceae bacterium]|jgi:carboxymethylenebutenolidase|nr:dienelactone hydrolase family protein [Rhodospirillaceae bacterium]MBT6426995.1 dienelactone hydrolase family protein [Rhodospirillaceae bacterium]
MPGSDIKYTTRNDETFDGYVTAPAADGAYPGILLITGITGCDDVVKGLADAWAHDGFVVSVPDIFWRTHPGPTTDREYAQARYAVYDVDQGMLDIEDLINDLKARPNCNGKVGVLGFCFGGRYAHLSAARLGADAAAAFHGTKIGLHLDETPNITCPVSYHFGDQDASIPMEEVDSIRQAYAGHANAEIAVYEDCVHNFSTPGKAGYVEEIAKESRDAVLRCFKSM